MTSVTINGTTRTLAWKFGAMARLGTIPGAPELTDLASEVKAPWCLACYLWAMLADEPSRAAFANPQAVADALTLEDVPALTRAIGDELRAATTAQKKTTSPRRKPSPSSS